MSPTFVTIVLIISLVLIAVPFVIVTVLKVGIFTNTEFQGPDNIRLVSSKHAAWGNITLHLSLSRNVTFGASPEKDKESRPSHISAQKQTYLRSVDDTADSKDITRKNASSMKKVSETATHNNIVTDTFANAVIVQENAAMRTGSGIENKTPDKTSSKETFAETATPNETDLKIETSKHAEPKNPAYTSAISESSPAPEVCGQLSQGPRRHRRIVGGSDAGRKQFPWVVMVLVNGRFWCAGSIIQSRHILTAAHCVRKRVSGQRDKDRLLYFDAAEVEVIAGKYSYDVTSKHDDVLGEQRVPVDAVIPHPDYDDTKSVAKHNDLALLVLRTPLRWTSAVSRICLPSTRDSMPRTASFAGWGSVKSRDRLMWKATPPQVLQQLTVRVRVKKDCEQRISNRYVKSMTHEQICAISVRPGLSSTCNGDSGGPLFASTDDGDERHVQYGVLSWGFCAARPGAPSFFTYLPRHLNWTRTTVWGSESERMKSP